MYNRYCLQSVENVIKVLDCFSFARPEQRLTDISRCAGISKPQAFRILTTLEFGNYVIRDPQSKLYRLGLRLFQLGAIAADQMDLRRVAQPILQNVAEMTHETIRLIVADDHGPICVSMVQSPKSVRVYAQLGDRMPWNAGTSGKVILAFLDEADRERILAREVFRKYTDHTIDDPSELQSELISIRKRGFHVNETGDFIEETRGVAAPIFDAGGQVVGAIGLAAPASRWIDDSEERFIKLIIDAAVEMTRQIGGRPWIAESDNHSAPTMHS